MSQTHPTTLRTDRLHLVAATPELLRAHLESFAALSTVLDAEVDAMPSDLEDSNLQWSLEAFERNPAAAGWLMWYFVLQLEDGGRRLVGVGGYKGPPSEGGTVEVGYAVVEDEQGTVLAEVTPEVEVSARLYVSAKKLVSQLLQNLVLQGEQFVSVISVQVHLQP